MMVKDLMGEDRDIEPAAKRWHVAVAGAGYVGMSIAVLLARQHHVTIMDTDPDRVAMVNQCRSPIADHDIEAVLATGAIRMDATCDAQAAYERADYVIVATPTNYDPEHGRIDTGSVDAVIDAVSRINPSAAIVVKSTVPIGYTAGARARWPDMTILFSPEFLREGRALHDNLHPSRIIVGPDGARAREFAAIMVAAAENKRVPVHLTGSTEAEAVKLFSNNFLAMRVAFFNELDSFCWFNNLDPAQVVAGVSGDPRIGDHYNNPSFGYGGYCLPKDTRQLEADFAGIPQAIISAITVSNERRKDIVAERVLLARPRTVGIYRLAMKAGSDNFRAPAIMDIMARLADAGARIIVHEPMLNVAAGHGFELEPDLDAFIARSDIILANRLDSGIDGVRRKVITRDLFGVN